MIGYETVQIPIQIGADEEVKVNIGMKGVVLEVPEVVIVAERLVEGASVSDVSFAQRRIESKDGLMEDPTKIIETMPGVASSGDLFSGSQLFVRGGAPEENLFLLDWARVHWPWYMGGMKSIFNSQIIEKMELLTGGFPPKYGQALSSVLSITTRDGRRDRIGGGASIGLITTQGLIEDALTPYSSFLLTTRRSYLDLLMGEDADFPVPGFYDGNIKLSCDLTPKHTLRFTGFASHEWTDYYSDNPDPGVPGKLSMSIDVNTQSLELNSILRGNLYSKFALTRAATDASVIAGTTFDVQSDHEIMGIREDITWQPHRKHEIKTGFELNVTDLNLNSTMPLDPSYSFTQFDSAWIPLDSYDVADEFTRGGVYWQDSYQIFTPLTLTGGVRYDYHFWTERGDWSPRLSLRLDLTENTALRAAWGKYTMFKDRMFLEDNPSLNPTLPSIISPESITSSIHRCPVGWKCITRITTIC